MKILGEHTHLFIVQLSCYQDAQIRAKQKKSILKVTAANSAQVSKFCFHRAFPEIKLSHLVRGLEL